VMPLQKNKLGEQARALYAKLARKFMCDYDETGSIGKRYRRQDEIGTPYCICVDFDTETTGNVTVRDRDTMQQEVVAIDNLIPWLEKKLEF
ncbi:MAG: His/Gly/Thr/Pro-type tRNA ligase C-terminal domain-containing protein, partial [Candidatus Faecivicinus sp.]